MTYSIFDSFYQLFRTTSDEYYTTEKINGHLPSASDYSAHLMGQTSLEIVAKNRMGFVMAKAKIYNRQSTRSPLVTMNYAYQKFVALFFRETIPADDAYALLVNVCKYYGIVTEKRDVYVLPYYNATSDYNYVLNEDGEKFKYMDDALDYLKSKQTSVEELSLWEKNLPFNDAPPCIQTTYLVEGKFSEDFENIKVYNDAMGIESDKEFTEPYKCENCQFCNKEICKTRKYKPNGKYVSRLHFGQLTQYLDKPTYYKWNINGKSVRLDSEMEIMKQERFNAMCFRYLAILPNRLNDDVWTNIVNRALKHIKVIGGEKITRNSVDTLKEILTKDMADHTLVSPYFEYERLMQGYIYLNPANLTFNLSPESLAIYISGRFSNIRLDGLQDIILLLKHLGFKKLRKQLDYINCSVWYLRSEFMFPDKEDWKQYLLKISKDTMWQENFEAMLLEDNENTNDEISPEDIEEIENDASIYLDTSKGDLYD